MTVIDARLGDFVGLKEFAAMVRRSPRTISRWLAEPDGLPHLKLGNETLIPIGEARNWIASKLRHPNKRRAA